MLHKIFEIEYGAANIDTFLTLDFSRLKPSTGICDGKTKGAFTTSFIHKYCIVLQPFQISRTYECSNVILKCPKRHPSKDGYSYSSCK